MDGFKDKMRLKNGLKMGLAICVSAQLLVRKLSCPVNNIPLSECRVLCLWV